MARDFYGVADRTGRVNNSLTIAMWFNTDRDGGDRMAVLSDADRILVWADWMNKNAATCAINKTDLRLGINAADQWCDDNAASYNNALPAAAKTNLTAKQKARLLAYVILRRFEIA